MSNNFTDQDIAASPTMQQEMRHIHELNTKMFLETKALQNIEATHDNLQQFMEEGIARTKKEYTNSQGKVTGTGVLDAKVFQNAVNEIMGRSNDLKALAADARDRGDGDEESGLNKRIVDIAKAIGIGLRLAVTEKFANIINNPDTTPEIRSAIQSISAQTLNHTGSAAFDLRNLTEISPSSQSTSELMNPRRVTGGGIPGSVNGDISKKLNDIGKVVAFTAAKLGVRELFDTSLGAVASKVAFGESKVVNTRAPNAASNILSLAEAAGDHPNKVAQLPALPNSHRFGDQTLFDFGKIMNPAALRAIGADNTGLLSGTGLESLIPQKNAVLALTGIAATKAQSELNAAIANNTAMAKAIQKGAAEKALGLEALFGSLPTPSGVDASVVLRPSPGQVLTYRSSVSNNDVNNFDSNSTITGSLGSDVSTLLGGSSSDQVKATLGKQLEKHPASAVPASGKISRFSMLVAGLGQRKDGPSYDEAGPRLALDGLQAEEVPKPKALNRAGQRQEDQKGEAPKTKVLTQGPDKKYRPTIPTIPTIPAKVPTESVLTAQSGVFNPAASPRVLPANMGGANQPVSTPTNKVTDLFETLTPGPTEDSTSAGSQNSGEKGKQDKQYTDLPARMQTVRDRLVPVRMTTKEGKVALGSSQGAPTFAEAKAIQEEIEKIQELYTNSKYGITKVQNEKLNQLQNLLIEVRSARKNLLRGELDPSTSVLRHDALESQTPVQGAGKDYSKLVGQRGALKDRTTEILSRGDLTEEEKDYFLSQSKGQQTRLSSATHDNFFKNYGLSDKSSFSYGSTDTGRVAEDTTRGASAATLIAQAGYNQDLRTSQGFSGRYNSARAGGSNWLQSITYGAFNTNGDERKALLAAKTDVRERRDTILADTTLSTDDKAKAMSEAKQLTTQIDGLLRRQGDNFSKMFGTIGTVMTAIGAQQIATKVLMTNPYQYEVKPGLGMMASTGKMGEVLSTALGAQTDYNQGLNMQAFQGGVGMMGTGAGMAGIGMMTGGFKASIPGLLIGFGGAALAGMGKSGGFADIVNTLSGEGDADKTNKSLAQQFFQPGTIGGQGKMMLPAVVAYGVDGVTGGNSGAVGMSLNNTQMKGKTGNFILDQQDDYFKNRGFQRGAASLLYSPEEQAGLIAQGGSLFTAKNTDLTKELVGTAMTLAKGSGVDASAIMNQQAMGQNLGITDAKEINSFREKGNDLAYGITGVNNAYTQTLTNAILKSGTVLARNNLNMSIEQSQKVFGSFASTLMSGNSEASKRFRTVEGQEKMGQMLGGMQSGAMSALSGPMAPMMLQWFSGKKNKDLLNRITTGDLNGEDAINYSRIIMKGSNKDGGQYSKVSGFTNQSFMTQVGSTLGMDGNTYRSFQKAVGSGNTQEALRLFNKSQGDGSSKDAATAAALKMSQDKTVTIQAQIIQSGKDYNTATLGLFNKVSELQNKMEQFVTSGALSAAASSGIDQIFKTLNAAIARLVPGLNLGNGNGTSPIKADDIAQGSVRATAQATGISGLSAEGQKSVGQSMGMIDSVAKDRDTLTGYDQKQTGLLGNLQKAGLLNKGTSTTKMTNKDALQFVYNNPDNPKVQEYLAGTPLGQLDKGSLNEAQFVEQGSSIIQQTSKVRAGQEALGKIPNLKKLSSNSIFSKHQFSEKSPTGLLTEVNGYKSPSTLVATDAEETYNQFFESMNLKPNDLRQKQYKDLDPTNPKSKLYAMLTNLATSNSKLDPKKQLSPDALEAAKQKIIDQYGIGRDEGWDVASKRKYIAALADFAASEDGTLDLTKAGELRGQTALFGLKDGKVLDLHKGEVVKKDLGQKSTGGLAPQGTHHQVAGVFHAGEYIVRADSVKANLQTLERINSGETVSKTVMAGGAQVFSSGDEDVRIVLEFSGVNARSKQQEIQNNVYAVMQRHKLV